MSWHAFYLNPYAPAFPGVDKSEHYAKKFGPDRVKPLFARLAQAGEGEGIKFQFGGRVGRTRDSHRVIWYAGQLDKKNVGSEGGSGGIGGMQTRIVEKLFRAYFEEEKNITDRGGLVDAGVAVGIERGEMEKLLDSETGGKEVDEEAERAQRGLVTGVPHFTVQGKYVVGGAEDPEVFVDIFKRVKEGEA